jgi:hypothetical protein
MAQQKDGCWLQERSPQMRRRTTTPSRAAFMAGSP